MKYSIENRSPFLDKEIINYSQKLDNSILINGSRQKVLLRETFKNIYILKSIILNKKLVSMLVLFLKNENKNKLEKFFYEKSEISKLVNMKLLYKNIKLCRISSDFAKFLFQVISIKIFLDYRRQNKWKIWCSVIVRKFFWQNYFLIQVTKKRKKFKIKKKYKREYYECKICKHIFSKLYFDLKDIYNNQYFDYTYSNLKKLQKDSTMWKIWAMQNPTIKIELKS